MKVPYDQDQAVIDELTQEQVLRSIVHCQRKAAEIGLTPSAHEKNMLTVYRALYENRKALLESMKEGRPELWTDFLDRVDHSGAVIDGTAGQPDESKLRAEIRHYESEASRLARETGTHEQNLHLAYALLARHRSQQLDALRKSHPSGKEGVQD